MHNFYEYKILSNAKQHVYIDCSHGSAEHSADERLKAWLKFGPNNKTIYRVKKFLWFVSYTSNFPPVSGTGTPVASYVANLDVAYSLLAGELKFSE